MLNNFFQVSFNMLWDSINILWLRPRLYISFQHRFKVILQRTSSIVSQYLLPLGWVVISTQIRFNFLRQYRKSGRFTNTVLTNKPQNLLNSRLRKSMKLKRVTMETMSSVFIEILWQINNLNRIHRASLNAQPTTNTKILVNFGNVRGFCHFYTYFL